MEFNLNRRDLMKIVDIIQRMHGLDVSTKAAAGKAFRKFIKFGVDVYGYDFEKILNGLKVKNAEDLRELFLSDDFISMLEADSIGARLLKTSIKLPTSAAIAKEMKAIYNKYEDNMSENPDDVEDPDNTYAIRTQFGDGPVVFVDGVMSPEGRREVRRWYAWMYKINYFEVRECTFDFWLEHEDTRYATSRMEYTDDDLYVDEIDESFSERDFRNSDNLLRRAMQKIRRDLKDGYVTMRDLNDIVNNLNDSNYAWDIAVELGAEEESARIPERIMDAIVNAAMNIKYNDMNESFNIEDGKHRRHNRKFDRSERRMNKYNRFDDEEFDDVPSTISKGDCVMNADGEEFNVIDILYNKFDVQNALRRRNYRVVVDEDPSRLNPFAAVATRNGVHYIYPMSDLTLC